MRRALVVLALMLATVGQLLAQLEPEVVLRHGQLTTLVRNATAETLRYDVELVTRSVPDTGRILLGRAVAALIAPRTFTLAPGQQQVIRVRIREVPPTPTLGLSITMSPVEAPADTTAGTYFTIVLHHVAKVTIQ